jgi:ribokinase
MPSRGISRRASCSRAAEGTELPAVPARAVDTTGAGDAFAGGLCAGLASGAALEQAVQLAIVTAAVSVERAGCQPSYARRAEISERAAAAGIAVPLP